MGPIALAGIGLGLKALGGLFGQKGKDKREKAAAAETQRANKATFDQNEQARIAQLQTLQNAFGGRGINLGTDPRLMEQRQYVGADPTKVAGVGGGWSALAGLFGGAGDVASGAAQSRQQEQILSAGQPTGGAGFDLEEFARQAHEAGATPEETAALIRDLMQDRPRAAPLGA